MNPRAIDRIPMCLIAAIGLSGVGCQQYVDKISDDDDVQSDDDTSDDDLSDDDANDDDTADDDTSDDDTISTCWDGAVVTIPAGEFLMGSPDNEVCGDPDEVQHEVTLTHSFLMGSTEVTQDQFESCMGYVNSVFSGGSHPVEHVTWHEAAAFTNQVSSDAGLDPCYSCTGSGLSVECETIGDPYSCEGYRLPTEAEWEFAARGGLSEQSFPNGGGLPTMNETWPSYYCIDCDVVILKDNGESLSDEAWFCTEEDGQTHPVGLLAANGYGLYDASGNVWEWCHDWHAAYETAVVDPWGPPEGSDRVRRGGAFHNRAESIRVAARNHFPPEFCFHNTGFRVARTMP